jgi:hypothetical protein
MKNTLFRLLCGCVMAMSFTGAIAQQQRGQQQQDRTDQMANAAIQNAMEAMAAQTDPLKLIFRKDVQHDLGLELGQRGRIDLLHDRQIAEFQQARMQQRQNRGRGNNVLPELEEKQRKEVQDKIDLWLTKEQKARLAQVALQLQGPVALFTGEIQKQLGITSEQNLRISQIQADRDAKIKQLQASMAAREVRPQDLQSRLDTIQKETSAQVKEMLTEEQQAELQKLFGKPFKVGG